MLNFEKLKIVIISIIAFLIYISSIYAYIYFSDKSKFVQKLSDELNHVTSNQISYEKIEFNLFPIPLIKLKRITITNGIFADSAVITPKILNLLFWKFSPKEVTVQNLYVNPNKTEIIGTSLNKLVAEFSEKKISIKNFKIGKLWDTTVSNRLILNNLLLEQSNRNVNFKFELDNDIKIEDKTSYSSKDDSYSAKTKIYSKNFTSSIDRKFNKNTSLSGEFETKISNLGLFVQDISPYFDFFLNDYINSNEEMTINGLITHDDEYSIYPKIQIKSPNFIAEGTYWSSIKDKENNVFELNISKLDLAALSKGSERKISKDEAIINLDSAKLKMQIKGNAIKILNDELNDFYLYGVGNGTSLEISNCSSKIGTDGNFYLTGKIEDNIYRPKFEGYLNISYPNINNLLNGSKFDWLTTKEVSPIYLSSKILVSPLDLMLSDFNLKISGQNIKGNVDLKRIVNDTLLIGDINLDDLNLDDSNLPIFRNIYNYFKSLAYNMSDESYDSKFLLLRNYPLKTSIDINAENMTVENTIIDRISMFTSFGSGRLKLDNYLINIGKNTIKGEALLNATSLKPQFKFYVKEGNLKYDNISPDSINQFFAYLNSNVNLSEIDLESEGLLSNIEASNLRVENIKWKINNKNNFININDLIFNLASANNKISGNILLNPIKINFAYGVDGADISKVQALFNNALPITKGFISINGQATGSGNTINDLETNLFIQGQFLGKDFIFNNLGIDQLILKLSTPQLTQEMANKYFKEARNEGTTSIDSINGSYEFNNQILSIKDINIASKYFTASSGIAISSFDQTVDMNAVFSFFPVGAKIYSPKYTSPIKLLFLAKGNLFKPDTSLDFQENTDIYRLPKLYNPQYDQSR